MGKYGAVKHESTEALPGDGVVPNWLLFLAQTTINNYQKALTNNGCWPDDRLSTGRTHEPGPEAVLTST
jgi:hypothetical protein